MFDGRHSLYSLRARGPSAAEVDVDAEDASDRRATPEDAYAYRDSDMQAPSWLMLPRSSAGALADQRVGRSGSDNHTALTADSAGQFVIPTPRVRKPSVTGDDGGVGDSSDSSRRPASLLHECSLSWQHVSFVLPPPRRRSRLRWLGRRQDNTHIDLEARAPPPRRILNNVWGRSAPGELTAIIGPSGAGKSTLLDVLAGRAGRLSSSRTPVSSSSTRPRIEGRIDVNGRPRDLRTFRAIMSYVPQEAAFLGAFSVLETLQFAAGLSLPAAVPLLTREMRVQDVIDAMGLRACAHTPVGDIFHKGISGGQRRRLAIAVELLANPSVLLLDEPTSGLDASSARRVMEYLARLSRESRKNVVCAIHQPSSAVFALLANLAVLSQGELVYFGRAREAVAHFFALGHPCPVYANPAEFFVHLVNADYSSGDHAMDVSSFARALEASAAYRRFQADVARDRERARRPTTAAGGCNTDVLRLLDDRALLRALRPSRWTQFGVLLHRHWLNNWRHPGVFWVRVLMYLMLALLAGSLFRAAVAPADADPRAAAPLLFYLQAFLVFMSVAALPALLEQRAVFEREAMNSSLHVGSYVLANLLGALPGILLIALLATTVVVTLAGVHAFGPFLLNLALSLVVAESCMHVLAAAVPHYIVGIALGAGVFGMFMLCEGFLVPRPAMPPYWRWAYYVAFHSYSFESFMYEHLTRVPNAVEARQVLADYGMENVNTARDMAVLAAYAAGLQIIFAALLVMRARAHRH